MKLLPLVLLAISLSSCAVTKSIRGPASNSDQVQLVKQGDHCQLNLDNDKEMDTVEIGDVRGLRSAIIVQPTPAGTPRVTVEVLAPGQNVVCITNNEPGAPFQGTDETQKAVRVNLSADYIRIGKPKSDARFVYYDASEAKYRSIYRGD